MMVRDMESNRVYELERVYYDDAFKRTIYEFHSYGCRNYITWNIPVYNTENLSEVLNRCKLVVESK